ncbi:DUF445 domain-containing protein [Bacillus ginsengihumi]|uniref:DUF445 domain-containing protein n=1 Tax=Heyndrickxia ginsengihumi TaxID=363870 RepID=A0A6M0P395_9BACI|nr:DUF445 family protein [Heyndrickxia ginsengihumi]MCM3022957.1 DUF445 family protein [Heyndrickxia ginsengihumi]NEY18907.1 DUF445 domain-containing protein [Heyndrickxia ginsengihumi]
MHAFLEVVFMVVIGAIIGGFTNYLAIKMLFFPREAKYIGKWRLPFTPGLIPKRRHEIAKQLGKLVVEHLVTPKSIEKKLLTSQFRNELSQWLIERFVMWMNAEWTIKYVCEFLKIHVHESIVSTWIGENVDKHYIRIKQKIMSRTLQEIFPNRLMGEIDEKIPMLTDRITQKMCEYIGSHEGAEKIEQMVDRFLDDKGMLGSMLKSLLGNISLAEKIQPKLIHALNGEEARETISQMLEKEWNHLKNQPLQEVLPVLPDEEIALWIRDNLAEIVNEINILNTPLQSFVGQHQKQIIDEVIPHLSEKMIRLLANQVQAIVSKLQIAELVQHEVESFPIQRVESLILSITSNEFKMITYLGAILGGVIGLFQGIIALLF